MDKVKKTLKAHKDTIGLATIAILGTAVIVQTMRASFGNEMINQIELAVREMGIEEEIVTYMMQNGPWPRL